MLGHALRDVSYRHDGARHIERDGRRCGYGEGTECQTVGVTLPDHVDPSGVQGDWFAPRTFRAISVTTP